MKTFLAITSVLAASSAFAGGGSSAGDGNPAAALCIELGGVLETVQTPAGQDANCVIDEWKLFREMSKRGLTKEHHYPGVGMPNPAAVNCKDIAGQYRMIETPAGQEGYCAVEEWKLYRVFEGGE